MVNVGIGKYGVWTLFWRGTPQRAQHIERLGYGALWLGASPRNLKPVRAALEATSTLKVGTSVMDISLIDPDAVAAEFIELQREFPGRALLGLGIGRPDLRSNQQRGNYDFSKPHQTMSQYLDVFDQHGVPQEQRFIAALGPKMLGLSADRAAGTIPYNARPKDDGTWAIKGQTIFISWGGDHEIVDNIVHIVLARTPDA